MTRSRSAIYAYAADLWREMREEYALVQEAEYAQAVDATDGNLVNARGVAKGWTSWQVMWASWTVLRAYGTEELLDHLRTNPRTERRDFERSWLDTYLGDSQEH